MKQRRHKTYLSAIPVLMALLILACGQPSPRKFTLVSGKTVYGKMAMEDAYLEIRRLEESRWHYFSDTRSGYHGSFRVHLPPGTYSLRADKTLRVGQEEVLVTGTLDDLRVDEPGGRIDQVVILMVPVSVS